MSSAARTLLATAGFASGAVDEGLARPRAALSGCCYCNPKVGPTHAGGSDGRRGDGVEATFLLLDVKGGGSLVGIVPFLSIGKAPAPSAASSALALGSGSLVACATASTVAVLL